MNDDLFRKDRLAAIWPRWRRWSVPLLIGACCLALAFGGEPTRDWASYDRVGVENGQTWRLLTANFVHLGWGHLWPNLLALLLIGGLLEEFLKPLEWLVTSLVTAVAIGLGLFVLDPATQWYVGLSGVLHGLVACGAMIMLLGGQVRLGAVLVVGLALKLAWEQVYGGIPLTAASVGGAVVVAAHLYGAVSGALTGLAFGIVRGRAPRL